MGVVPFSVGVTGWRPDLPPETPADAPTNAQAREAMRELVEAGTGLRSRDRTRISGDWIHVERNGNLRKRGAAASHNGLGLVVIDEEYAERFIGESVSRAYGFGFRTMLHEELHGVSPADHFTSSAALACEEICTEIQARHVGALSNGFRTRAEYLRQMTSHGSYQGLINMALRISEMEPDADGYEHVLRAANATWRRGDIRDGREYVSRFVEELLPDATAAQRRDAARELRAHAKRYFRF